MLKNIEYDANKSVTGRRKVHRTQPNCHKNEEENINTIELKVYFNLDLHSSTCQISISFH